MTNKINISNIKTITNMDDTNFLNNELLLEEEVISSDLQTITIPDEYIGERIDVVLAKLLPEFSRTKIIEHIKAHDILINNLSTKPKVLVHPDDIITIKPFINQDALTFGPEDIPLNIVFEDEHILVIDKPAGLVVHPGNGNWQGTLLNAILFYHPEAKNLPRAGIVHRLDKDTSGLMVVAKTLLAQNKLVALMQERKITRIYRAIVEGTPHLEGVINKNIGRDMRNRTKMATTDIGGKDAVTHFRVLQYFNQFSYVECKLETGRTHQIRVHFKHIKHPLVGDKDYGTPKINYPIDIAEAIITLNRQALHAVKLIIPHPITTKEMTFYSKLPQDFKYLLHCLYEDLTLVSGKEITMPEDFENFDDNEECEVFYVK